MRCAECGLDEPELVEGACPRCYARRHAFATAPAAVDVVRCAHCGAVQADAGWSDSEQDDETVAAEAVRASVETDPRLQDAAVEALPDVQDERNVEFDVDVGGRFMGLNVRQPLRVKARLKRGVCERCSKQTAGYFNAVIQVRATERDPRPAEVEQATRLVDDAVERERRAGNPNAFVTRVADVRGGRDYYLGAVDTARHAVQGLKKAFAAETKESPTLWGKQEGREVYRITFLVRIPAYKPGDFVVHDESVLLVRDVGPKSASLLDLGTYRATTVQRSDLEHVKVLGGEEARRWAVVVSNVRDEMLLLDPETYQTVEAHVPQGYEFPRMAPSVPAVKHEGRLWLAPYAAEPPGEAAKRLVYRPKSAGPAKPREAAE